MSAHLLAPKLSQPSYTLLPQDLPLLAKTDPRPKVAGSLAPLPSKYQGQPPVRRGLFQKGGPKKGVKFPGFKELVMVGPKFIFGTGAPKKEIMTSFRKFISEVQSGKKSLDPKSKEYQAQLKAVFGRYGNISHLAASVAVLADYLNSPRGTGTNLRIEVHTDSSGKEDENLALSQRRAEALKLLLEAHGVQGCRLKAIGLGEKYPLVPEIGGSYKERLVAQVTNRRVEFIILDQNPCKKPKS